MELIKTAALARQRVTEALTDEVQTNQDLYDHPSVREACKDSNHVSIILSDLRRAGTAVRERMTVPGTNIKYAYKLNPAGKPARKVYKHQAKSFTPEAVAHVEQMVSNMVLPAGAGGTMPKPEITVTDTCVTIDMAAVRIIVQLKGE